MRRKEKSYRRKSVGNTLDERYFGKFRGKISKVRKGPLPEKEQEEKHPQTPFIKAVINTIGGQKYETPWAPPVSPNAGLAEGQKKKGKYGTWQTPQLGDIVWIEFEQGDTRYPLWTGFAWSDNTFPAEFSEEEYLKELPEGGEADKTEYQESNDQTPKQTHKDNVEKHKEGTNTFDLPKSKSPDDPDPVPNVFGEKTPSGYFWLVQEDKGHFRLHTPNRNYLLLDNDEKVSTLNAYEKVLLRDQDDDRAWVEVDATEDTKRTTVHGMNEVWLRDKTIDDRAWVEVNAEQEEVTNRAQNRINMVSPRVNLGSKDAPHNLLYGDVALQSYNNHSHVTPMGPTGPPTPAWSKETHLSQTSYTNSAQGDVLKAIEAAIDSYRGNDKPDIKANLQEIYQDVADKLEYTDEPRDKAILFEYLADNIELNLILSATNYVNNIFEGEGLFSQLKSDSRVSNRVKSVVVSFVAPVGGIDE